VRDPETPGDLELILSHVIPRLGDLVLARSRVFKKNAEAQDRAIRRLQKMSSLLQEEREQSVVQNNRAIA
jgi:hypothetical protein